MTNNKEFNSKSKNPFDLSNDAVRFSKDEELGLITVEHPEKNNAKKLPMKDVLKKMDNNQGGMA